MSEERVEAICAEALALAGGDVARALVVLARTLRDAEILIDRFSGAASAGMIRRSDARLFFVKGDENGSVRFGHG